MSRTLEVAQEVVSCMAAICRKVDKLAVDKLAKSCCHPQATRSQGWHSTARLQNVLPREKRSEGTQDARIESVVAVRGPCLPVVR